MNKEDRAVELFQQNKTYKEISEEIGLSRIGTGMLIAGLRKAGRIGYRNAAKIRHQSVSAEIITLQTGNIKSQLSAFMKANKIGPKETAKLLGVSSPSIYYWLGGNGPSAKNRQKIVALISGGTRVLEAPKKVKKIFDPIKIETPQEDFPRYEQPYWHLDREIMSRDPSKIRHILRALWRHLSPR